VRANELFVGQTGARKIFSTFLDWLSMPKRLGDVRRSVMTAVDAPRQPGQAELWDRHAPELLRYATLLVGPNDAADVVSITFAHFERTGQRAVERERAYLFRAVTNTAIDQLRSRQRRQVRDLHAVLPAVSSPHESQLDIRRAVAALSVQQRSVVYFTYWEDLDATQIATLLGISPDSVRRHLARARVHLRKALR
jgi:RNA polymerase sigma factor (sigma-70 family)